MQSAALERIPPHTLRIRIQEREPVAQITVSASRTNASASNLTYLLDAEGWVMPPLDPRQRVIPQPTNQQFPTITGANLTEVIPGKRLESPQIRSAIHLICAFDRSTMAGWVDLRRVDTSALEALVVTTDQDSEVTLSTSDLDRQFSRWRQVFDLGIQQSRSVGTLDLSVLDNIPLRWLDMSTSAPPTPKPKKVSLYKKKHV